MLCLAKRTLTFMRPILKFPVLWPENLHFRELLVIVYGLTLRLLMSYIYIYIYIWSTYS